MLLRFYLVSCAFILVFFAVGLVLKRREIVIRTATLLGLTQLTCLALWLGPAAFAVLAAVVCVLGSDELLRPYGYRFATRVLIIAATGGFFVLPLLAGGWLRYAPFPLYLAVAAFTFAAPAGRRKNRLHAVAFVAAVVGYGAGFFARLDLPTIAPVLSFLLLLQCNDAFGYLVGGIAGRRRLFPVLSPKKTIEGYLGGAIGIGIALFLLVGVVKSIARPQVLPLLMLAVASAVIGNIGDLLFSSVKRSLGIKDFGKLLPGHGGILDRFDNVLFGAPSFFIVWHLIIH